MNAHAEILLRTNRRAALAMGGLAALPIVIGGVIGALGWLATEQAWRWGLVSVGAAIALIGAMACVAVWRWQRLPRIALDQQQRCLWVLLDRFSPVSVPLDVVECFFFGQAPSPLHDATGRELETRNVVVRLAERAVEWHERHVASPVGRWCGGYITVYGTWCEPLSRERVEAMNHQLVIAKRQIRSES